MGLLSWLADLSGNRVENLSESVFETYHADMKLRWWLQQVPAKVGRTVVGGDTYLQLLHPKKQTSNKDGVFQA